jgi:hypothetical protein
VASNVLPAIIRSFFDEDTFTVAHVISDPEAAKAAIIDGVSDFDPASEQAVRGVASLASFSIAALVIAILDPDAAVEKMPVELSTRVSTHVLLISIAAPTRETMHPASLPRTGNRAAALF